MPALQSDLLAATGASSYSDFKRHILVGIDLSDQSWRALQWAAAEVYREGDLFHLIHVSRYLQPQMTIQHGYAGASYTIPNLHEIDEDRHAAEVKEVITARFTPALEEKQIPYMVHYHFDTDNAPASSIAGYMFKVAEECKASMIIVAAHNKAYTPLDNLLLGSVAAYLQHHSSYPLIIHKNQQRTSSAGGAKEGTTTTQSNLSEQQASQAAASAIIAAEHQVSGSPRSLIIPVHHKDVNHDVQGAYAEAGALVTPQLEVKGAM